MLQNHISPGLAIFDKHHQTDLPAVLDIFFGWGRMWVELYQVTDECDVYNLKHLANKVWDVKEIQGMDVDNILKQVNMLADLDSRMESTQDIPSQQMKVWLV